MVTTRVCKSAHLSRQVSYDPQRDKRHRTVSQTYPQVSEQFAISSHRFGYLRHGRFSSGRCSPSKIPSTSKHPHVKCSRTKRGYQVVTKMVLVCTSTILFHIDGFGRRIFNPFVCKKGTNNCKYPSLRPEAAKKVLKPCFCSNDTRGHQNQSTVVEDLGAPRLVIFYP